MAKAKQTEPKIIESHDYLSIVFGNGRRLTIGRSGEKATGAIPEAVFTEFHRRMREETKVNYLDRLKKFVAEINTIWPEWNKPPRQFTVGERVKHDFGKRHGGIDHGTVYKVARSIYVKWDREGNVSMSADLLAEGMDAQT